MWSLQTGSHYPVTKALHLITGLTSVALSPLRLSTTPPMQESSSTSVAPAAHRTCPICLFPPTGQTLSPEWQMNTPRSKPKEFVCLCYCNDDTPFNRPEWSPEGSVLAKLLYESAIKFRNFFCCSCSSSSCDVVEVVEVIPLVVVVVVVLEPMV